MEKFLFGKKWVIYHKIKKLENENLNISSIALILNISRDTVYKYKKMNEEEFIHYMQKIKKKKSIFDKYKEEIEKLLNNNNYKTKKSIFQHLENTYNIKTSYRNFLMYLKKEI